MLGSFLPPVPSLPSDPPEHFPLRKTGECHRQAGDPPRELRGWALNMGCLGGRANWQKWGGWVWDRVTLVLPQSLSPT